GPATYGMGAWYNPWRASFARSGGASRAAAARSAFESWDAGRVQRTDQPIAFRANRDAVATTGEPATAPAARANREVVGTTGELATPTAPRERPIYAGRNGCVY